MSAKVDYRFWIFMALVAAWFYYAYHRKDDPDMVDQRQRSCSNAAIAVAEDALKRGMEDEMVWKLAGYTSLDDFVQTSKRSAYHRCKK